MFSKFAYKHHLLVETAYYSAKANNKFINIKIWMFGHKDLPLICLPNHLLVKRLYINVTAVLSEVCTVADLTEDWSNVQIGELYSSL